MRLIVTPGHPLRGEIGAGFPGDKSISHRAALFAALAHGESCIENFLISGVTQAMLDALTALGVPWRLEKDTLYVQGSGIAGLQPPKEPINCGSSGTTMRLLAGALAAAGIPAVLSGTPGLCRRPMRRIVAPLQLMGVPIEASTSGTAPLRLASRKPGEKLSPIDYDLPVASAQVKTCILLAALGADGTTIIREPGPSRDHTERMLARMGVGLASQKLSSPNGHYETQISLGDTTRLSPLRMTIPGDFSSAAFLIVAALVTPGSELILKSIGLNPTRTGLLDALKGMGADIQVNHHSGYDSEPVGDIRVKASSLQGIQVGGPLVVRMIDEFPVFAVASAFACGDTLVRDAVELRYKESDRITILVQELRSLGVGIEEASDGFVIKAGQIPLGGVVQSHADHRLGMALAVVGLAAGSPVTVEGAEIISESFPDFTRMLGHLGASLRIES
ncbi:MAG: 3-phosphoshikimate 1-carboxyvinyltransferase [Anaerolineaceae bacterium]|nr:3-phosphoshikimate 1-carboxyvinyltransferase [Anaerolineaceae bacterium]